MRLVLRGLVVRQGAAAPIAIVGGGLAGLSAARRLHQAGISFQLFEARDRLGGRILSTDLNGVMSEDGFDLGPSWFWPQAQPEMARLIAELGLKSFRQHDEGDLIVQYGPHQLPERLPSVAQQPASMRFVGGTSSLVRALADNLPEGSVRLSATVRRTVLEHDGVALEIADADGALRRCVASRVVFAMPPRLLAAGVSFDPAIDAPLMKAWGRTPTWMAPYAKFFAVYDRPFWREAGLSGTARSIVGPLTEIHDATTASGRAALFGFVGVPARQRLAIGKESLAAAALHQLVILFGPSAATPLTTLYKDWAADPFTATSDDQNPGGHPMGFRSSGFTGSWQNRLFLAGSETSAQEPGYLAGALDAADRAVRELVSLCDATFSPHVTSGTAMDDGIADAVIPTSNAAGEASI